MKRYYISIARRLFIATCMLLLSASVLAENNETFAGDWTLKDVAGISLNYYADSNDSVSVILFWATWCPFCRSLMPHLQQVADEFEDKAVKFYALNVWEDGNPEKHFLEKGFTFRLLLLADLVAEDYKVLGTPGLMVMDKSHRIVYMRQSGEKDIAVKAAVREAILRALDAD